MKPVRRTQQDLTPEQFQDLCVALTKYLWGGQPAPRRLRRVRGRLRPVDDRRPA